MEGLIRKVLKEFILEKEFNKPRKMKQYYCKKTPCSKMGYSQKASCRPYNNCYK